FSSRRRHTRSKRDWSSDVCSSDLGQETLEPVHFSATSHAPAEARQTKLEDWKPSAGQVALVPVHFSAASHTSTAARQTVLDDWRSEEHTSELQSRFDLVCRLLLEK